MGGPRVAENEGVDIRLLGGVDVVVAGERIALGGAKPRALLAALALQPGTVVTVDRLVDDVWGEAAPPSVRSSVQVHVSQMRRALTAAGAGGLLETRGSGYALAADAEVVDAHRFRRHVRDARAAFQGGRTGEAAVSVMSARLLWRGAPLAGLGDAPFVSAWSTSLEHDHLALVDLYADIEIALGRPAAVVAELEQIVSTHPFREPTWARLAIALYRSGRQVDALDRLRAVRHLLAEELGLDPSPEIRSLELAILHQDPVLGGGVTGRDTTHPAPVAVVADSRLPATRVLFGRDDLVRSIEHAVLEHRLVTVVGPGGAGKTTVAVTAASKLAGGSSVTARFVDLSTVDDADGVVSGLMTALATRADDTATGRDAVVAVLNAIDAPLVVLDNCEHVIEAAAAEAVLLLGRCPHLRVLATSRSPLCVADEVVVGCDALSPEAAVDLFVARAREVDRSYAADDAERAAIEAIARTLDGLPLAIELFAARVTSLSAADMLERLDDETVLTTAWRTARSPRHRSLHDAVAWSVALLDDDAQVLLRRMSVFGGSVGNDGIEAVCRPARGALEQLVTRSLVVPERTVCGVRYRQLSTVRAFASAALADDPDRDDVRRRLVAWVTGWAAAVRSSLAGERPADAIAELDLNAANVRTAYDIAVEQPGASGRLLAAFGPNMLTVTPALPEAVTWARRALDDPACSAADRMLLQLLVGRLSNVGTDERRERVLEAIALAERAGDASVLAAAWGVHALISTDVASDALSMAERAMALSEDADDGTALAFGLTIALTSLVRLRRFDDVDRLVDRYCTVGTRRFGVNEPLVLYQCGRAAMLRGDLAGAAKLFEAVSESAVRTGAAAGRASAWYGLAEVARLSGRVAEASALYRRCLALDLVVEPGETPLDRMMIVWTACLIGELEVAEEQAAVLADEMRLETSLTEGTTMIEASAVGAEALLALAKGRQAWALDRLRTAIGMWATSDSWDIVADLVERLPEADADPTAATRYRALAVAIRDGSVDLGRAVAEVGAPSG